MDTHLVDLSGIPLPEDTEEQQRLYDRLEPFLGVATMTRDRDAFSMRLFQEATARCRPRPPASGFHASPLRTLLLRGWYASHAEPRWSPCQSLFGGRAGKHLGVDLAAPVGETVYAPAAGEAVYNPFGYDCAHGNHCFIYCSGPRPFGVLLSHLHRPRGSYPRRVLPGEALGAIGYSFEALHKGKPNSFGKYDTHLHLEVVTEQGHVDPLEFFGFSPQYLEDKRCFFPGNPSGMHLRDVRSRTKSNASPSAGRKPGRSWASPADWSKTSLADGLASPPLPKDQQNIPPSIRFPSNFSWQAWKWHAYALPHFALGWLFSRLAQVLYPRHCAYLLGMMEHTWHSRSDVINRHVDTTFLELLAAGEDKRFLRHHGFDLIGIARAVIRTAMGSLQGGSTIEQQLVRSITRQKNISLTRKIREIMLACCVSCNFSKRTIAALYLYLAYYGAHMNNLAQAVDHMAAWSEDSIPGDISRAALLVSQLKYPAPKKHCPRRKQAIVSRARYVQAMHERLRKMGWFHSARWDNRKERAPAVSPWDRDPRVRDAATHAAGAEC